MGSFANIYDDVAVEDETKAANPIVGLDGGMWLAEQLTAGLISVRVAAAALRCQAREIVLLRRHQPLEQRQ